MVVDHVEDDLDAGAMQRLDHPLELLDLLAVRPGGGVGRVRRQEADRRVAPVVRQPSLVDEALLHDLVHREQLHRRDAERGQVLDGRVGGEAGVGAAQILAHAGMPLREALDVQLVDDGLVPRGLERPVALPVEAGVDDDAAGHRDRVVGLVRHLAPVRPGRPVREGVRGLPAHAAVDRLGVGIEQQLGGVEAVSALGCVGAVHAQAVALARADAGEVAVPVEGRPLRQLDALFAVVVVEQAELDPLRMLGEDREVRAAAVPSRTQRERTARPDRSWVPVDRQPRRV